MNKKKKPKKTSNKSEVISLLTSLIGLATVIIQLIREMNQ